MVVSIEQYEYRLRIIQETLDNYTNQGKKLTQKKLLEILADKGHKITRSQLQKDKERLNVPNTFLADLAKKNYSKFIETRVNTMQECSKVIHEIMTAFDTDDSVKLQAAKTLHSCEIELAKLVSGDVLRISASNWALYVRKLEDQVKELQLNKSLLEHRYNDNSKV